MAITGIITDTKGNKIYPVTKASSVYTSTGMTVEEALTFRQTPQHATYADGVFTITSGGLTSTPKPGQTLVIIFDSAASVAGTNAQLKLNSGQTFPMYIAGATYQTAFNFNAAFDANLPKSRLGQPFMFVFCDNNGVGAWLCIAPNKLIGQNDIENQGIKPANIGTYAVTTAKIANANVTTAKIADGAITSAKLASGAVGTAALADGAVTNAKIGSKAVKSDNIDWATVEITNVAQSVFYSSNPNVPSENAIRMVRWGKFVQVIVDGAFMDNWAKTWLVYVMGHYNYPPASLIQVPIFDQNNSTPILLGYLYMSPANTNVEFRNFALTTATKGKWARGSGFYIAK